MSLQGNSTVLHPAHAGVASNDPPQRPTVEQPFGYANLSRRSFMAALGAAALPIVPCVGILANTTPKSEFLAALERAKPISVEMDAWMDVPCSPEMDAASRVTYGRLEEALKPVISAFMDLGQQVDAAIADTPESAEFIHHIICRALYTELFDGHMGEMF